MNTMYPGESYPLKDETFIIIGVAMEIHRIPGKGFSEIVYNDAFEYECKAQDIWYEREKEYADNYKRQNITPPVFCRLLLSDKIIGEIKSKKGYWKIITHRC